MDTEDALSIAFKYRELPGALPGCFPACRGTPFSFRSPLCPLVQAVQTELVGLSKHGDCVGESIQFQMEHQEKRHIAVSLLSVIHLNWLAFLKQFGILQLDLFILIHIVLTLIYPTLN